MPKGNPHPVHRFAKGNPGRPVGCKTQTQLLKEKILKAALNIDIEGSRKIKTKKGFMEVLNIEPTDVLKLGAGFVPKETKTELTGSEGGPLIIQWEK